MQIAFKDYDGVNGGKQTVYKFDNGYGASVVCHDFSYGGKNGLKELAVVVFGPSGDLYDFKLCYNTPLTDDVIGWLTDDDVSKLLTEIDALPPIITVEPLDANEAGLLLGSGAEEAESEN